MKNLLALVALVLAFTVGSASAQSTSKKEKTKVKTEQTASKESASAGKSCCASHGASTEAKEATGIKTASTSHEHGGAMCDPKNCTEAQKKQCAGAKGKGCCMGSAAKTEETTTTPTP